MKLLEEPEAWVGPYRLLAELGAGGMGRVYLASGLDGALVAVKQIDPRYADDKGFRARFGREVDAARRVSGAYTASVITADSNARRPWLASVYVPGPSLAEALEAVGVMPEEAAVQLAARLASALADIHRAGLVHRDLKPSNVLLAEDGLRVIDFGIVRAVDAGAEATLTTLPVGSPAFMSPEQAQHQPISTASDMFSLGILLAAAATGRHPFNVPGDVAATLRNIVTAQPDLSAIPPRLRGIVERCLAKDPARRPTPAQVLALAGTIAPTSRPWPPAVYDQIARRRAEVDRLLSGAPESTQVLEPDQPNPAAAHLDPRPSFDPPDRPASSPQQESSQQPPASSGRRSRTKLILWLGVGACALALIVTASLTVGPGREWLANAIDPGTSPSPTAAAQHSCSIHRGSQAGSYICEYGTTDITYDSRCHTFVVGTDKVVWYAWEITPTSNAPCNGQADQNGTWSTFQKLGGQAQGAIRASAAGSTLTVDVTGTDNNTYCNNYTPNTGWSAWHRC